MATFYLPRDLSSEAEYQYELESWRRRTRWESMSRSEVDAECDAIRLACGDAA